jgi:hypothetical protein
MPIDVQCGGGVGLGNMLNGALSGMINTMILNYSLVVGSYPSIDCDLHLTYKPWIPTFDLINIIRNVHSCDVKWAKVHENQHNELYFFKNCFSEPGMPLFAKDRANIFFQTFVDDIGRFTSYGVVQHHVLEFSEKIKTMVRDLLPDDIHNYLKIGVQLRHNSMSDDQLAANNFDGNAQRAMIHMFNMTRLDYRPCLLLAASDHESSLNETEKLASLLNCKFYRFHHQTSEEIADHGPWGNALSTISDWYLLRHSDVFVGSTESSYSVLMASDVAYNSIKRGYIKNPLLWIVFDTQKFFENEYVNNARVDCHNYLMK